MFHSTLYGGSVKIHFSGAKTSRVKQDGQLESYQAFHVPSFQEVEHPAGTEKPIRASATKLRQRKLPC
jgi:hypothetical protein